MLAQKLKKNKTLKELELNEDQMTSEGFISLCNALRYNQTLEKISLSENQLTPVALQAFSELLK
jgi:Ran GTPase-activating protein (RanGAP) involved in mRNA processing and transport